MAQRSSRVIARKARFWPNLPRETVSLPQSPAAPAKPNLVTLVTLGFSVAGMIVSTLFLLVFSQGGSGVLFLGVLALSGFTAIGSLFTFAVQSRSARRQRRKLETVYQAALAQAHKQLLALRQYEEQERLNHDPPFIPTSETGQRGTNTVIVPLARRSLSNQDMLLWARQPSDVDFLGVRIGTGTLPASYHIEANQPKTIALPGPFSDLDVRAREYARDFASVSAPITLSLAEANTVTIVDSAPDLSGGREAARVLVAQIAYHHSPEDVRVIILASPSQAEAWKWTQQLPHTRLNDIWDVNARERPLRKPAVAITPDEIDKHLVWISREAHRREEALGEKDGEKESPRLPHLVIIVDHPDPAAAFPRFEYPGTQSSQGVGVSTASRSFQRKPIRPGESPLSLPELTLPLARGAELGYTVVAICPEPTLAPATTRTLVEIQYSKQAENTLIMGCIQDLQPDAPPARFCKTIDKAPLFDLEQFASRMESLRFRRIRAPQLPAQVDLCEIVDPPLDLSKYAPTERWKEMPRPDSLLKARSDPSANPSLRIPVGARIGEEIQYLDIVKDGPHGILIGQTGSGKSELLQTIITALAVQYSPEEVNLLLIDYKAGLALEPYRTLPHTIGFLTNISSPGQISRFITMLAAEKRRRELRLRDAHDMPRLLIIIDEFAEMLKRAETILEEIFSITKLGRELGMHLLLSAQRPEGVIGAKVRDYVQYRFCLRAASTDDSREVLGRNDAAFLSPTTPGRGYLLHGDNQLDLFQSARVTLPIRTDTFE